MRRAGSASRTSAQNIAQTVTVAATRHKSPNGRTLITAARNTTNTGPTSRLPTGAANTHPAMEIDMSEDDKFWRAVERADQRYNGNLDKDEWIDAVVCAGAKRADAKQMFADAHEDERP